MQWRVLVPIKHGAPAKTRLRAATREQAHHAELVRAIQLDTLDAVLALRTHQLLGGLFVVAAPPVEHPVLLPAEIELLPDAGGGLNPALAAAAAELARRHPGDGVLALVGDLPALRSADLLAVLRQAPATGRSFVRDLDGSGTTLLAAGPGSALGPLFGPDSAHRHLASGARELEAAESLRCDVDSAADLRRCLELGVGMLTSQLLTHLV
ncbi:MAG: 2-phospho-L-lactate/phosphoenolpyruvate guanylyltransferase [Pseudonocardiales bacterium]|nr:2-phospho-L-lactate/phosphoenolpyruvate guanylyltransferase [Pseudonocardiales bacterium]